MVGLERLLIGRTLGGRYAVEELIGRGRGGLVYRARDAETGSEVALKVLAAPQSAEARERYRRLVSGEVGVAAAIAHPNVVAVHSLGVDPELDLDFVTFELARGQTLAAVLAQRGNPPVSLGLRLLADAAEGLAAGHRAGLLHRDVRPASLYLVRSEVERQVRVKVGGFGVPQLVRRESLGAAPPEVSAYASPEMLATGSARLTPASDVFGLGVVGFQLMTGALPLDDAARRALAEGRAVDVDIPLDRPPAVPPHVFAAVLQALRTAPAERFADAGAFAEALRQPASAPAVAVPAVFAAGKIPPVAREAAPVEAAQAFAAPETAAVEDDARPSAEAPPATIAAGHVPAAEDVPAAAVAGDAPTGEVDATPGDPPIAVADAAPAVGFVALAGGVMSMDDAPPAATAASPDEVAAPAEIRASTPAPAEPPAAAPPVAPAPGTAQTRKAPAPRATAPDLELYYPPQPPATPPAVPHPGAAPASPVATHASVAAPAAAAPELTAAKTGQPLAVAAAEAATPAPAAVARTSPAVAPTAARPVSIGEKRQVRVGAGRFRGSPAMAAGFVLGMLVLGTVGWMATHTGGTDADASEKLAANAVAPAATPAADASTAAAPGTEPQPAAVAAPDTGTGTAEARRRALEEARKRQQDADRKQQQDEQARLALLQQQQAAAAAQAAAEQPAARPQTVTLPPVQQPVAVVPRPAPPPAPPPPPAPAPAREEAAPTRPAANEVFSSGEVEERPRLTNGGEIQRALQLRYPDQLTSTRVSGAVMATFVVNADGRVDGSTIRVVSSPNPAFNVPTQAVLRRARFRPATVGGQPVRVQVTMPVQWTAPPQ